MMPVISYPMPSSWTDLFFSCVGNMVLLPTPLKAFTDTMPEIKSMLRICARNLYGWQCDHESMSAINCSHRRIKECL
jgi:hypothetical protein